MKHAAPDPLTGPSMTISPVALPLGPSSVLSTIGEPIDGNSSGSFTSNFDDKLIGASLIPDWVDKFKVTRNSMTPLEVVG